MVTVDPTVLVALRPTVRTMFEEALEGAQCNILFCHSIAHAQSMLNVQDFDAVLATLQFDESRMFDLLRMVRAHPSHRSKPFVAVRMTPGRLTEDVSDSILRAAVSCGADASINYANVAAAKGVNAANRILRDALTRYAARRPGSPDLAD